MLLMLLHPVICDSAAISLLIRRMSSSTCAEAFWILDLMSTISCFEAFLTWCALTNDCKIQVVECYMKENAPLHTDTSSWRNWNIIWRKNLNRFCKEKEVYSCKKSYGWMLVMTWIIVIDFLFLIANCRAIQPRTWDWIVVTALFLDSRNITFLHHLCK